MAESHDRKNNKKQPAKLIEEVHLQTSLIR